MITMYDSADAETIPLDATVAAGYVNGKYQSFNAIVRRVPHATHLSITVNAETPADIIDVELGDVPPPLVPGWVTGRHKNHVDRPIVYADLTRMKLVLDELHGAGIDRSSVRLWSAHYPESLDKLQALGKKNPAELDALNNRWAHICGPHPDGCDQIGIPMDGTQFTNWAHHQNLDQSLLHDDFFGGAHPQVQGPPPSVFTVESQISLAQLAQNTLHNAVSTILRLTAEHSPGAVFTQNMADYLNGVFAADKEKVPRNVTVYHPDGNGTQSFVSAGTQTLQGLALAFKCQPSAIVRLTAKQSPGAVFSAEMADYLNDVFGRSATPIPEGIHLYYEK